MNDTYPASSVRLMPIRPFQLFKWLTLLLVTLCISWAAYYYYHMGFGRTLAGVAVQGIPQFWTRNPCSSSHSRSSPRPGSKGSRIYDQRTPATILAQISDLSLDINYANLFQQEPALNAVDLHDAKISIPVDPSVPKAGRIRDLADSIQNLFFSGTD